ncbi:hypothetical protein CBS11350_10636 [Aspergillus niger]|nr:hypothetical protein CBS11350_10636 [Aspergillus niger]
MASQDTILQTNAQSAREYILSQPSDALTNNPWAVYQALDLYSRTARLMNFKQAKLNVAKEALTSMETPPKVVIEFGTYIGCSAIAWAAILRDLHGPFAEGLHIYTFEVSETVADVARDLIRVAGVEDIVHVMVGPASESLAKLVEEGKIVKGGVDMAFFDHWEKFYLSDLKLCEDLGLFRLKKDNNTVRLRPLITITNPLLRNGRLRKLSTNDYLVLAGTFHGVHAITRSITPKLPLAPAAALATTPTTATTPSPSNVVSPSATSSTPTSSTASYSYPNPGVPATGLECLETDKFRLTCFQTLTGTKFLLFTDPLMANIDVVMKKIYELYADFVMKNPFYQLEMPVRCEAFDRNLQGWLRGRT